MCAGGGEEAWRRRLVIYPDNCTYLSVIGRISVQGEGAWWWRLAMYPDNFTYLSVIGRISVQWEGAWRRRLQTRTRVQALFQNIYLYSYAVTMTTGNDQAHQNQTDLNK